MFGENFIYLWQVAIRRTKSKVNSTETPRTDPLAMITGIIVFTRPTKSRINEKTID